MEKKIQHKQRTHAAAVERSAQARKLLESAQEAVQRADAKQKERAAELKALQADLKAMQARVEADGQESTGNSENAPTTASLLGPVCQEFSQKPEIAEKLAAADAILAEVRALAAAASPEAPSPAPPVQQQQEQQQQQQQQLPSSDAQGQDGKDADDVEMLLSDDDLEEVLQVARSNAPEDGEKGSHDADVRVRVRKLLAAHHAKRRKTCG